MDPLLDSLQGLKKQFLGERDVEALVDTEMRRLNEWIAEHSEDEKEENPRRKFGDVAISEDFDNTRSIFDDVDT